MNFKIFTLFPEIFDSYLKTSILGRGLEKKLWSYQVINIRDYSTDKYKHVDDVPFGGGCGMIIKPDVIANAIDNNCNIETTKFYYMSPRGKVFNQYIINEMLENRENKIDVAIICGRYEGIDQRVIEEYNMEEISIGDFILTGGELPALSIIDACVRCIEGVLGDYNSIKNESFGGIEKSIYNNLLEYPLYTQPRNWRGREVPEILLSGHHSNIEKWQLEEAKKITKERRPDLWKKFNNE